MDFESIISTIQPFLIMFAALFAAFLTATWISVVIWAFRDIRARSRDIFAQILATLMVLVFFPLFPFPGLGIYLILRPRETLAEVYERSLEEEALLQGIEERLACPGCNRRIEEAFMICPTCHTRLKKACPACGRLLHLRWNICPYCGAVQTAVKSVTAPAQPMSIAVEGPGEAPRIAQARTSALSEPSDGSQAEPYGGPQGSPDEPEIPPDETESAYEAPESDYDAPDTHPAEQESLAGEPESLAGEPEWWLGDAEAPDEEEEEEEETSSSERDRGPGPEEPETLPFDFE